MEEILKEKLPQTSSRHKAFALVDRGLVGQFTGIGTSPWKVITWVQKSWKPLIKGKLHQFCCGWVFFASLFEFKEDKDLIF